jgi:Ca2+-binding RTX toxin-like protein
MAVFTIDARSTSILGTGDVTPAMNSYNFFYHPLRYTWSGLVASDNANYTPTYTSTSIDGTGLQVGGFPYSYRDTLTGSGLTVSTAGGFSITGGTITGFETREGGGISFTYSENWTATGFSMSAVTFWNLTTTQQWHALWVLATAGDDTMTGSNVAANPDFIEGGAGSDTIYGRAGDDQLWGNNGRDFIYGGDGNDVVVCNDWAAGGASTLWSEAYGDAGDDYLFTGGYGSGYLVGGAGTDRMWGGPQSDFLNGGAGIDYMAGGLGRDVFEITSTGAGEYDFILDFQDGVDFIKLPVGAAWAMANSANGVWLQSPTSTFGILVSYATVATIADQIYYA